MTQPTETLRFGSHTVETIVDGPYDAPRTVLRHSGGPAALDALLARVRDEDLRVPVNAMLLRGPDGVSLIDAGCGTGWGEGFGRLRPALEERGLSPAAVDRVILTHLHGDHALGLFDGDDAWFPRAEIWVPTRDWAFFRSAAERATVPVDRRGGFDVAERVARTFAGRIREIGPGEVLPGVTLEALPGHTPGHSGYRLEGPEGVLLIVGDALHFATLQLSDPATRTEWDMDGDVAERTRREVLERVRRNGWTMVGGHIERCGPAW